MRTESPNLTWACSINSFSRVMGWWLFGWAGWIKYSPSYSDNLPMICLTRRWVTSVIKPHALPLRSTEVWRTLTWSPLNTKRSSRSGNKISSWPAILAVPKPLLLMYTVASWVGCSAASWNLNPSFMSWPSRTMAIKRWLNASILFWSAMAKCSTKSACDCAACRVSMVSKIKVRLGIGFS